jgi:hypothetical protein
MAGDRLFAGELRPVVCQIGRKSKGPRGVGSLCVLLLQPTTVARYQQHSYRACCRLPLPSTAGSLMKSTIILLSTSAFCLVGFLLATIASAAGDRVQLTGLRQLDTNFSGGHLSLAANSTDKEVLVAWDESFGGGSPNRFGIVGQRVTNSGDLVGSQRAYYEVVPPETTFFWEINPELSYSATANRYLLTSRVEYDARYPDRATKGRILSPNGEQSGSSFLATAAGFETTIAPIPNTTTQLIVSRAYPANLGIYAGLVDSANSNVGAMHRISAGPVNTTTRAAAAVAYSSSANRFLSTMRCFDPYQSLEGQVLEADGTPSGQPFQIAAGVAGQLRSTINYDVNRNRFLVAYEIGTQIRGQFVDTSGQLINSSFVLYDHPVANVPVDEVPYSLAFDPALDQYLLVAATGGTKQQLVAQLFGPNGNRVGGGLSVGSSANTIISLDMASTGNGSFYLAWDSADLVGFQTNVYGTVLSVVPEPSSVLLFLIGGTIAFATTARRRK